MSGRGVRRFLFLLTLGAIGWWIYAKRPTAAGIIDTITRPVFGTSAAVRGSERNRVVSDAGQVLSLHEEEKPIESLRAGMTESEVEKLLGKPEQIDVIEDDGESRVRWTYRSLRRIIDFRHRRLVAISVR